jgi:predicted nucleic acid-binding protein
VTVVADTGALYALIDSSDAWHARVRTWWASGAHDVIVPTSVLPEVCYLLQTRIGPLAEIAFLRAVVAGEFALEPVGAADLTRVVELVKRYADLPLGYVDATLVAVAERVGARTLLTTDRRHFGVVRGRGGRALTAMP